MRRTIRLSWPVLLLVCLVSGASALLLAWAVYRVRHPDPQGVEEPPPLAFPKATFPLALEPGGRYLIDHDNRPFLIHGEAAWSLAVELRPEDAELYLEDRRRRGVNLLMVNLIEHWFSAHPPVDAFGVGPFRTPGDFATPNPEYFERIRALVRTARSKGQVVLLCPAYLGGDGSPEGWYLEMTRAGVDKLRGYGRYVGGLFKELDNVIWLAGGDFTPPASFLPLVDAIQQGIKEAAPNQLQVGHWSPEMSGLDVKLENTRFALNTTYTYHPAHLKSLADYGHGQLPPHFLIETKYEGDKLGTTQRWVRNQAYTALLTGAVGEIFGNYYIWTFTQPSLTNRLLGRNWRGQLDSPGSRSMGFVRRLFQDLPWMELVPDERWEILVTGQGAKDSINFPVLASTRDGRLAVAYVPALIGVRLDMSRLKQPMRARWYDPTSGRYSPAVASPLNEQKETPFVPVGKNAAGDTDWVLRLDASP